MPVPDESGVFYIQGKNGNYMTVVTAGTDGSPDKIIFQNDMEEGDEINSEQRFNVIKSEDNKVTIQTGGDRGGVSKGDYLFVGTPGNKAQMQAEPNTISLIPARETGNGSC